MTFKVINDAEGDLAARGYRWAKADVFLYSDAELLSDIRINLGENYADSLTDTLWDGYVPICQGDDGKLYAVLFRDTQTNSQPIYWSHVEHI